MRDKIEPEKKRENVKKYVSCTLSNNIFKKIWIHETMRILTYKS